MAHPSEVPIWVSHLLLQTFRPAWLECGSAEAHQGWSSAGVSYKPRPLAKACRGGGTSFPMEGGGVSFLVSCRGWDRSTKMVIQKGGQRKSGTHPMNFPFGSPIWIFNFHITLSYLKNFSLEHFHFHSFNFFLSLHFSSLFVFLNKLINFTV